MPITPIDLGSRSNPGRYGADGTARLINMYMEDAGGEGKAPKPLYACAGLKAFASIANTTGVRASIVVQNYLYAVIGRLCYRFDAAGTAKFLGGIPTDGPVYMARNGRAPFPQIGVVSDGLYFVIEGDVFSQVIIAGLPASTSIAVLDGYFILPSTNSGWYVSDQNSGKVVDLLSFANAESDPDEIVRAATRERELVLFGSASTEWWQDTGGADFPFTRSQAITTGCLSAQSVARVDRTLAWIADDGTVRLMQGYAGQRVSTHAVERSIADDAQPDKISGCAWFNRGHWFYCISGATFSWQFDMATGLWVERLSYGLPRWRIATAARFGTRVIAGDYATGRLYDMAEAYADEDGAEMICTIRTPQVHGFPYRTRHLGLYLDFVPGVGLNQVGDDTLVIVPGERPTPPPSSEYAVNFTLAQNSGYVAALGI